MLGLKKRDIKKALKVTAMESFKNNLIRLCTISHYFINN